MLSLRELRKLELATWRVVNAAFDASHKIFVGGIAFTTAAGLVSPLHTQPSHAALSTLHTHVRPTATRH